MINIGLKFAKENCCKAMFATNAVELLFFAKYFAIYRDLIAEITVTIDGCENEHNKIRVSKNGDGSFSKIIQSVDFLLDIHIPVNVATNIGYDNINQLEKIFQIYEEKGWTKNKYFSTIIGRIIDRTTIIQNKDVLYESHILDELIRLYLKKKSQPGWLLVS